jgi:iron complex outermembrane recepter protein
MKNVQRPSIFAGFFLVALIFNNMVLFALEIKSALSPVDPIEIFQINPDDSIIQFNQFGSFGLFNNGIRATVQQENYHAFASYGYRNFNGYRYHSNQYEHLLNLMFETLPTDNTRLQITGYYIDGLEKRPGSLTKKEFEQDPFQADPRAVNRDEKRVTRKGQLEINYQAAFGNALTQKIEITAHGALENYIRSTREFKIINRYGLALTGNYSVSGKLWKLANLFSAGVNLFMQPERTEEYENFSGQKSDQLEQIKSEKTSHSGCYLADNFELISNKLFLSLTGRYDLVDYHLAEETLPSREDSKQYHAFTPEVELDFNLNRNIKFFTSYGWHFKSPTDKELDSFYPAYLYNQDLRAQISKTIEAGIDGSLQKKDSATLFKNLHFHALFFRSDIEHEIIPYEIYGDEFFRNATMTNRVGFELGVGVEIAAGLTLSAIWTYNHFRYREYSANSLETDSTGNIVAIFRDFAGNKEPNFPLNKVNLSLSYRHSMGRKTDIFADATYQFAGGLWVDDANSDRTSSKNLVNMVLGIDQKFGHFVISATAGINNIFDQIYVGYANINSADKRYYDAGAPRNYFGSVNFEYIF